MKNYIIVFVYKIWNIQIHFIIGGIFMKLNTAKLEALSQKEIEKLKVALLIIFT